MKVCPDTRDAEEICERCYVDANTLYEIDLCDGLSDLSSIDPVARTRYQ